MAVEIKPNEDGTNLRRKVVDLVSDGVVFKPPGQTGFVKFKTMAGFELWRSNVRDVAESLKNASVDGAPPMGFWARRALADVFFFKHQHGPSLLPLAQEKMATEVMRKFSHASYGETYEVDQDEDDEDYTHRSSKSRKLNPDGTSSAGI